MTESTKACSIEKCKHPYRAKGYCHNHYKKWRRGEYGHARYDTCSQNNCIKAAHLKGLCAEHFNTLFVKKDAAPAALPVAVPEAAPAA